ncbi:MAG TPA: hypothetical protein VG815_14215 [Chloroflexota bacterium]|jgi:hypothetical protein|nr:hypothetical protein [Chloroflexota bacterium]
MTFTVLVLDRGRPIAKHSGLDRDVSHELVLAYRAIGWPDEKIVLQADHSEFEEKAAA